MSADMFPAFFPRHIFHLLVEAVMLFPVTEEKAPGMMTEKPITAGISQFHRYITPRLASANNPIKNKKMNAPLNTPGFLIVI